MTRSRNAKTRPVRALIPPKPRPAHRPKSIPQVHGPATPPAAERQPTDVPRIRREIADWLTTGSGPTHYLQAIQTGRQQVMPTGGTPTSTAARLATAERRRLTDADLWYVDADLCTLLAAAYPTMPTFAPRPEDLPSLRGFVVFAEPIDVVKSDLADNTAALDQLAPGMRDDPVMAEALAMILEAGSSIIGASWGPISDVARATWPAGGCWITFYGESFCRRHRDDHPLFARAAVGLPAATPDNECAFAWWPDGTDPDKYLLPADANGTTDVWARMLFGVFRLAAQRNLVDADVTVRALRHDRKRDAATGLPEREVRVIRLRPALQAARDAHAPPGAGREYRHRWIVRGHWRNVPYGPGRALRRPAWIAPYLAGPDGAPLLGGDKVTVI